MSSYQRAISKAKDILKEFDITSPQHIEIDAIAASCGAYVHEKKIAGSSARLVRGKSEAFITINEDIEYSGQKRFSIAHELGHFLLHESINQLKNCSEEMMYQWYRTSRYEPEANAFASELLMPSHLFSDYSRQYPIGIDTIKELASIFNTSLTATAIRYVEHGPFPCFIVLSRARQIVWFTKSHDFRFRIISPEATIHNASCANDYFTSGIVPESPEDLNCDVWLEEWPDNMNITLSEHAIPLPKFDSVLSLIWVTNS